MLMLVRESKNHEKEKSQDEHIVENRSIHQHPSVNLKGPRRNIFLSKAYCNWTSGKNLSKRY